MQFNTLPDIGYSKDTTIDETHRKNHNATDCKSEGHISKFKIYESKIGVIN